jgi:hypothetical protein
MDVTTAAQHVKAGGVPLTDVQQSRQPDPKNNPSKPLWGGKSR